MEGETETKTGGQVLRNQNRGRWRGGLPRGVGKPEVDRVEGSNGEARVWCPRLSWLEYGTSNVCKLAQWTAYLRAAGVLVAGRLEQVEPQVDLWWKSGRGVVSKSTAQR